MTVSDTHRECLARERWLRVAQLFSVAMETLPSERDGLLERECTDDEMRREIQGLLQDHDALSAAEVNERPFLECLDLASATSLLDAVDAAYAGTTIDRYEVIRQIGRGATGAVYLALDSTEDRQVAVKLLARWLCADPLASRRFLSEAHVVSELNDPRIAAVYRSGATAQGQLFIAMEYLEGMTLRERLAAGPLPLEEALGIALRVAEGLSAAHARAIVHRDIKPENILLADRGACVLDFGIAKLDGEALTRPGTAIGTTAYMSPEQTRGDAVDRRTDVWSLGVVLYEMLTGTRPFGDGSPVETMQRIRQTEPVSAVSMRPGLPARVLTVLRVALEKHPEHRYPSAEQLRTALALCIDRR